jgi:hypothetical protein
MARKYKRDGSGRFAGGGGGSSGGGSKRPAAKTVSRGVNRLTRDNAGKITSVGGEGATARGGRLRTAAGNKRAMQTAKVSGGSRVGTMKGKVKRDPGAMAKVGQGKASAPKTPSNKIAASPRQLSKNEQIARDVMTNKSFRSDRQRIAEMQRRGIDRNTDFTGLVANVRAKQGGGTTAKIKPTAKPATAVPKPAATAKSRASQMRERATQLDQRGRALMSGGRRDTAVVNLSLNSRARRNETNAGFKGLEMTRNAERLRSKADGIEYRSNESRAKKLRSVHETPIAKAFAKKAGKSVTEVRAAIRSMSPEKQIKMFKQHVKETRSAAKRKP